MGHMEQNLKDSYKKLKIQVIKATLLASIAIISSLIFVLLGNVFIFDLGWFSPVDGTYL